MSKINLLPWREEVKKILNYRFYATAALSAVFGFLFIGIVHLYLEYRIEIEKKDIEYIQQKQKPLTGKVQEIAGLTEIKKELLSRMAVIQSLQSDRIIVPKLLDVLARSVPEGVYLNSITRKDAMVSIMGDAKTNAGISSFLQNIQDPKWGGLIRNPKLTEAKFNLEGSSMIFKIDFTLANITG